MGYMVYIDDKSTRVVDTLEEAKHLAAPYIVNRRSPRIESLVAPAPSQIWIYDFDIEDWVEQR
jgi:hypothetical protein